MKVGERGEIKTGRPLPSWAPATKTRRLGTLGASERRDVAVLKFSVAGMLSTRERRRSSRSVVVYVKHDVWAT
jgi:hypothetical protein